MPRLLTSGHAVSEAVLESNDALSGLATKMKFQVSAEELVAVATDAVQC